MGKEFQVMSPDIHSSCQGKQLWDSDPHSHGYVHSVWTGGSTWVLLRETHQRKIKILLYKCESQVKIFFHIVNMLFSANSRILSCILALGQTCSFLQKDPVEVTIFVNCR